MAVETAVLKSFRSDFCLICHGAEKQEGGIRRDDLTGGVVAEGVW